MKKHISDTRTGVSPCKSPIHVYKCGLKNKYLNEPFFEINVMIKVKSSNQLGTYENYFCKKGMTLLIAVSIERNNKINLMNYSSI